MMSAKWRPFCPGGDELNTYDYCANRMCERDTEAGVNHNHVKFKRKTYTISKHDKKKYMK